jgi:hypothetical protein
MSEKEFDRIFKQMIATCPPELMQHIGGAVDLSLSANLHGKLYSFLCLNC